MKIVEITPISELSSTTSHHFPIFLIAMTFDRSYGRCRGNFKFDAVDP